MKLSPKTVGLIVLGVAVVAVAATRPWVVAPLDANGQAIVGPVAFDPEAYVAKVWSEQLPGKLAAAVPAAQASAAPAFLKGQGVVMKVDTTSRVGTALVDLDPQDGKADVTLQIGPVVPGSSVRDALGLQFADFDTQVDYANVGSGLNKKALAASPLLSAPAALEGKRVSFVGAGATSPAGAVRLVPVKLDLVP